MPSLLHEALVDLFRKGAELAPALLATCAAIKLEHARVTVASNDLSQVVSIPYRADAVIALHDQDHNLVSAVVVEVQLGIDKDKPYTWPLYLTALRAQLRRPVRLLVLTHRRSVARWARAKIALGHPGFELQPVVVSFKDVPRIIDPSSASKLPELAVLSAMAHPQLDVSTAAIHALTDLPADQQKLYLDIILSNMPETVRTLLEARMKGYVYQSEFARRYVGEGRSEGRVEGRIEGRIEGLRDAALMVARAKRTPVTDDDRAAIAALNNEVALTALIDVLLAAHDASDVRIALEAVAGR